MNALHLGILALISCSVLILALLSLLGLAVEAVIDRRRKNRCR